MHFLCVSSWIMKTIDLWWKNVDINRTQGEGHMINKFFGSSLGKI